jgi:hypothetical protein
MSSPRFGVLRKVINGIAFRRAFTGKGIFPASRGATDGSRRRHAWIAAIWLGGGVVTRAAAYDNDLFSLEIPSGFEGPTSSHITPTDNLIVGWAQNGTQIRIFIFNANYANQLAGTPKEQRDEDAAQYFGQFLQGIKQSGSLSSVSAPVQVSLDSIPAARVSWRGVRHGRSMVGTVYSVIVGTRVISFQVETGQEQPKHDFDAAMRSIEAVRFKAPLQRRSSVR